MEEMQQQISRAHLEMARQELRHDVDEKGVGGSRIKILALLTR